MGGASYTMQLITDEGSGLWDKVTAVFHHRLHKSELRYITT